MTLVGTSLAQGIGAYHRAGVADLFVGKHNFSLSPGWSRVGALIRLHAFVCLLLPASPSFSRACPRPIAHHPSLLLRP